MNKIKKILSSIVSRIFVLLFILLLALILGRVIAFFEVTNEAIADNSYFLMEEKLHQPFIKWIDSVDVLNKQLSPFQLREITNAYTGAWYRLNKSLRTNNNYGLEDYFSDSLVVKISQNFEASYYIDQVDLQHELALHLISLDETVVVFNARNIEQIREINAVSDIDSLIQKQDNLLSYDIVMKLTDGKWKIMEMVRKQNSSDLNELTEVNKSNLDSLDFQNIKGINYYPANSPWHLFWNEFSSDTIRNDFKLIEDLGYNTVRIFIPFFRAEQSNKGYSNSKLDTLLNIALQHNIKIIPTLFDFPASFDLDHYPCSANYIKSIVAPFASHTGILAWDLKNEPDLDFEVHGKRKVLDFLHFAISELQKSNIDQAVTIGWMKAENAIELHEKLDFVSFHFYDEPNALNTEIKDLKNQTNKPVLLGEYGYSSYGFIGSNEQNQQSYNKEIEQICNEHGIPHLVWTLHDFKTIPDGVFGWKPWIKWKQSNFGITSN